MARNKPTSVTQSNGAPAETNAPPAFFLSLSLENVRCFGRKQTLDLSDGQGHPSQWTILLGNNGTGKTTVLQALTLFELKQRGPLEGAEGAPARFLRTIRGVMENPVGGVDCSLGRNEENGPACLEALLASGSSLRTAVAIRSGVNQLKRRSNGGGSATYNSEYDPTCCGYGASRRLGTSSLERGEEDSVASLFSDRIELRNASEWLLRLDYSASKKSPGQKKQAERLEQVKRLLINILPEITGIRLLASGGEWPTPRVEFETPFGWIPLRHLGYGYQSMIAWMVDFASRMVERFPDSADPLAEPAIVLVDEIDLHLHPTWQRNLIGFLSERFRNTQFIVTAHSPLVVQAAPNANIAVLRREGDHVVIDQTVQTIRNWRIDQIYTSDLFGLPSARPPQLDDLMKRRSAILSKPKLTKADERELAALDEQIGPLPGGETAEDARSLQLVRESLDLLKQEIAQQP
jgi:hypothetical protein